MPRTPARKAPWQIGPTATEQVQACFAAADMHTRGATWGQIAAELGLASPADAKKSAEKGYALAPGEDYRMARRKAAAQLDMLTREFLRIYEDPGWATTVSGKIILDPGTGKPMQDRQAKVAALNGIRAVNAEYRKLFGTDAPRQTVSVTAASSLDEIHAHIARVRAEIAAEGGEPDQDWDGPPALPPGTG